MSIALRPRHRWQLRNRVLELGSQTRIFGIVNVSPDSFSGDGHPSDEAAVAHGLRLLEEGADGLDIGGESTRPGSGAGGASALSAQEEQDRVLPVIEGLLREHPGVLLSIDTYRASTARAAVAAGAEIVNDVSGLGWDPAMTDACAELACGVVLMHTRGRPSEWKHLPPLAAAEVLPLVHDGLASTAAHALQAGIARQRIVLDPGYGFGKIGAANYALLARQIGLLTLGYPILAGLSRKSFLAPPPGQPQGGEAAAPLRLDRAQRDRATAAACVAAVLAGAAILRVHDVSLIREAATVADALLAAME